MVYRKWALYPIIGWCFRGKIINKKIVHQVLSIISNIKEKRANYMLFML